MPQADIRMPQGSPPAGGTAAEHHPAGGRYSAADVARFARKNRMHAKGGRALLIGLAWVLAKPEERGEYLTPLSKAFRLMLREGVEPPDPGQVQRAIEAVMTGTVRARVGRIRNAK
jgi:hypothetical protein